MENARHDDTNRSNQGDTYSPPEPQKCPLTSGAASPAGKCEAKAQRKQILAKGGGTPTGQTAG